MKLSPNISDILTWTPFNLFISWLRRYFVFEKWLVFPSIKSDSFPSHILSRRNLSLFITINGLILLSVIIYKTALSRKSLSINISSTWSNRIVSIINFPSYINFSVCLWHSVSNSLKSRNNNYQNITVFYSIKVLNHESKCHYWIMTNE